jgi:membrane associated rhomboid family serine protease
MACVLVASWLWTIAGFSLRDRPVWALVFAAMGGFAIGVLLMIAVYEDRRRRDLPRRRVVHSGRLKLVRVASA